VSVISDLGPEIADLPGRDGGQDAAFRVRLHNFEGPFDLLLQLISRHKMDITEVALSRVTGDFIAHIKAAGADWDLDQTSQFVVVAATLLDLKAARLIPSGEIEDPEDLALLEARDLLFARLLQYRAFKQVAAYVAATLAVQARRFPRQVGLEARFARLLPEVRIDLTPEAFAALAARALAKAGGCHLAGAPAHPGGQRRRTGGAVGRSAAPGAHRDIRALAACRDLVTVVARFRALLELFKGAVSFEQLTPLGELTLDGQATRS
jgi:segregation and condensation protein A